MKARVNLWNYCCDFENFTNKKQLLTGYLSMRTELWAKSKIFDKSKMSKICYLSR